MGCCRMARVYRFIVGSQEAGLRLDHYLVRHLPVAVSRSAIQRVVREGGVTIGEAPVKANQRLRAGDVVLARFDQLPAATTKLAMTPQEMPLEIVHEDAHVLVVNKPAGLVTHPAPGHWDGTLVNGLLWHLQHAQGSGLRAQGKRPQPPPQNVGGPAADPPGSVAGTAPSPEPTLPRAGIVHRLDKDTSGLLLVAKTDLAHAALSRQMKVRAIKREYLAVVEGHLPLDRGTIDAAIARHTVHRKEMTIRHLGGRAAVTHYRVLKRFGRTLGARGSGLARPGCSERRAGGAITHSLRHRMLADPQRTRQAVWRAQPAALSDLACTLIAVALETGRTHQIRVHMAHLGFPVAGDTTYGKHAASFWDAMGVRRQLLHAFRLTFRHPAGGQSMTLTAPVPDDMKLWAGLIPCDQRSAIGDQQ